MLTCILGDCTLYQVLWSTEAGRTMFPHCSIQPAISMSSRSQRQLSFSRLQLPVGICIASCAVCTVFENSRQFWGQLEIAVSCLAVLHSLTLVVSCPQDCQWNDVITASVLTYILKVYTWYQVYCDPEHCQQKCEMCLDLCQAEMFTRYIVKQVWTISLVNMLWYALAKSKYWPW